MPGAVSNPLAEVPACAVAAPTFPRPRGRAPPGCTWDPQRGGWWRADGSAWKKVRNEKRLQAREARRVEKAPEKAAEQKHRESFAAYWAEEKAKCKEKRESLKRAKEERLQLKSEARQAREAEAEARKARVQEVLCDGETVYCAKHLYQLSTGDVHGEMCGACVDLGWRDVRHAPPPAPENSHTSPKLIRTRALTGASSSRMGASSARTTLTAVAQQALSVGPRTRPTLSRARCSIVKIRDDFEKTFGFLNMARC